MNEQGRPTAPVTAVSEDVAHTFTGNRALQMEEPLIFETGRYDVTGVDLPKPPAAKSRLGKHARTAPIDLPGLTEPEAMRHYVRLSQKNYAIDSGLYPLGSCTMKHNPRLNEKMVRLPGFADIHPLQPVATVTGATELITELGHWLLEMTGMRSVAMSPKAGAHGELCGMMAIKAALTARGDKRSTVLVPESAHGTNPATAALLGYSVVDVPAREDGTVDPAAVRERLSPDVAAIMLTNPNTCGLFERDVVAIADAVHEAGALFYADGANFNAIVGKVKPGDLGVDAMHINLHKTFSTPHGGGGPGAGPVVFSDMLAPYAPVPFVRVAGEGAEFVGTRAEAGEGAEPFGRMTAFHGQMGMFVRAMAYMFSHGADGMRQASDDAVLNANYVRAGLRDLMSQPFGDRVCMHEVLFDDHFLDDTGVTTLDFAKAMIDEGYHPMTMYFPLVVHGAMLIEPTESESKASLDLFIATLRDLVMRAKKGEAERFRQAPQLAPRRRLDETRAARQPKLKWEKPAPWSEAAE
ncbi:aminomethyl-transferring glycine dehydrogenase subunit GcvPB [Bauldia litoralis]|uniref:aminomethyl-transferring glycine dehydrogenase subunit GcvPB n=1 Tax=Bauldia litoralis TaxID=665467 RepID=UPI003265B2BC